MVDFLCGCWKAMSHWRPSCKYSKHIYKPSGFPSLFASFLAPFHAPTFSFFFCLHFGYVLWLSSNPCGCSISFKPREFTSPGLRTGMGVRPCCLHLRLSSLSLNLVAPFTEQHCPLITVWKPTSSSTVSLKSSRKSRSLTGLYRRTSSSQFPWAHREMWATILNAVGRCPYHTCVPSPLRTLG